MSELTFKIHMSIDGFVGRPDGDLSWLDAGFEDQELVDWELDVLWHTDLHLMGRVLYHHPVVLGEGLPIFSAEQVLRLEEARVFASSGAVATTYRPA